MRPYLLILLVMLSCQDRESQNCTTNFFENLTNDFGGNSNYIILDVKVDTTIQKICIDNYSLFSLLNRKQRLTEEAYKNFVKELINKKDTLSLNPDEILPRYIVQLDDSIKADYKKGLDFLKTKYFKNNIQRKNVIINNTNYMAYLLFENCIISRIDDYTGFMIIKDDY